MAKAMSELGWAILTKLENGPLRPRESPLNKALLYNSLKVCPASPHLQTVRSIWAIEREKCCKRLAMMSNFHTKVSWIYTCLFHSYLTQVGLHTYTRTHINLISFKTQLCVHIKRIHLHLYVILCVMSVFMLQILSISNSQL